MKTIGSYYACVEAAANSLNREARKPLGAKLAKALKAEVQNTTDGFVAHCFWIGINQKSRGITKSMRSHEIEEFGNQTRSRAVDTIKRFFYNRVRYVPNFVVAQLIAATLRELR